MVRSVVTLALVGLTSCNWDEGPCYLREDIEGGGVGGGPIVPGWGGYGDVPLDPQNVGAGEPVECSAMAAEVRCAAPGTDLCVQQCDAIGAYCVHLAAHPYSPSSGVGALYWCKGGKPTWTCSYKYDNGDNCTRIYPFGKWLCRY